MGQIVVFGGFFAAIGVVWAGTLTWLAVLERQWDRAEPPSMPVVAAAWVAAFVALVAAYLGLPSLAELLEKRSRSRWARAIARRLDPFWIGSPAAAIVAYLTLRWLGG